MTKASYISISPGMLRPDTKSPFDTFLRRDRNYVLFNAGGGIFTEAKRQELVNNNIDNLYIDSAALNAYRDYLQDNIADASRTNASRWTSVPKHGQALHCTSARESLKRTCPVRHSSSAFSVSNDFSKIPLNSSNRPVRSSSSPDSSARV